MLRTLGHPVATCFDMLSAANRTTPCESLSHEPGQTNTTSCNIHKCCMKNLTIFKLNLTTSNMSQHVPTGSPNALNMLHSTMLRSFGRGFTQMFIVMVVLCNLCSQILLHSLWQSDQFLFEH